MLNLWVFCVVCSKIFCTRCEKHRNKFRVSRSFVAIFARDTFLRFNMNCTQT